MSKLVRNSTAGACCGRGTAAAGGCHVECRSGRRRGEVVTLTREPRNTGDAASDGAGASESAVEPRTAPRFPRADGPAKATGQARYTADLAATGLAHGRFLTAGRAHARIVRLDTTRARSMPGVYAVVTGADVPHRRYGSFGFVEDRYLFANDVVRVEGDGVSGGAAARPQRGAAAGDAHQGQEEGPPPLLPHRTAPQP